MKDQYIELNLDTQSLDEQAELIFMNISGISRKNGNKKQRMINDALQVRESIKERIKITAVCKFYDKVNLERRILSINEMEFSCSAFELISNDVVKGAYLYVISVGNISQLTEPGLMSQLYADLWGNAYIDAARNAMKKQLEEFSPISDSFGPGFYGMESNELIKMEELLDFEEKGISVKNGNMMIPLKTCTGIIFKVNDNYQKLHTECEHCRGNHISCSICSINRR